MAETILPPVRTRTPALRPGRHELVQVQAQLGARLARAAVDVIEIKPLVQLFSLGEFTAGRVCARPLEPVA
ncbi:hypothetical protein AOLI_G00055170 [Acnodon oligacanthus]